MATLSSIFRASQLASTAAEFLLRTLLDMDAEDARDTAARARVARDVRPAPDGWDELENVR
jgi:hypothetical protein